MEISKKDWKLFREKLAGWQENYMDKLTKGIRQITRLPKKVSPPDRGGES